MNATPIPDDEEATHFLAYDRDGEYIGRTGVESAEDSPGAIFARIPEAQTLEEYRDDDDRFIRAHERGTTR